jgi:Zn finger protein HypA/HybF involved in hydrogenase expression
MPGGDRSKVHKRDSESLLDQPIKIRCGNGNEKFSQKWSDVNCTKCMSTAPHRH